MICALSLLYSARSLAAPNRRSGATIKLATVTLCDHRDGLTVW
jgi:hypothetical protein